MQGLFIFNLGKRSRLLVAMALAVIALATLLLGVGSEPSTASASTLPPARPENTTAADTYTVFLPMIWKGKPIAGTGYYDDFSDSGSGWNKGYYDLNGRRCTFTYTASDTYRITMTKRETTDDAHYCLAWNDSIPRQFYGTFRVRIKRTSDSTSLRYGFQFDTAKNSTEETGTRWALEEYPKDDSDCNNHPYFWLTALKSGDLKYFNATDSSEDDKHECTDVIDTTQNHWNEMAVVRNGRDIRVYLRRYDAPSQKYTHESEDVYQLATDEDEDYGYFQLRLVATGDSTVSAEFDDVQISTSTSAPW